MVADRIILLYYSFITDFGRFGVLFLCDYLVKEDRLMFSDELRVKIFGDDRMKYIPVGSQAAVIRVVEDVLERRFYTEYPNADKHDILADICER